MKTMIIEITGNVTYQEVYDAIANAVQYLNIHSMKLLSNESIQPQSIDPEEELSAGIYHFDDGYYLAGSFNDGEHDYNQLFPSIPVGFCFVEGSYAFVQNGQWWQEVERSE